MSRVILTSGHSARAAGSIVKSDAVKTTPARPRTPNARPARRASGGGNPDRAGDRPPRSLSCFGARPAGRSLPCTIDDVTWRLRPELSDTLLGKGFNSAERALALNASLPLANRALGNLHLRAREYGDALRWTKNAVALNPHDGESHAALANILSYIGRSDEALHHLTRARELDPSNPPLWDYYTGRALVHLGSCEEALRLAGQGLAHGGNASIGNLAPAIRPPRLPISGRFEKFSW